MANETAAVTSTAYLSFSFDVVVSFCQVRVVQAVNKMGAMGNVMKMIPGMSNQVDDKQIVEIEKKYMVFESIIQVPCCC